MSFSGECLEGGVGVMYLSGSLRFRSPDSFQIFLNQYNIILTLKVQTHYQNSSVIIKLKLLQAPLSRRLFNYERIISTWDEK